MADLAGREAPMDRRLTFERLTQARLNRAYRLAAELLDDDLEAEDAVHDAAEQAWAHWGDLRDVDRFDAWFERIVVNRCRDRLRRRRRHVVLELDAALEMPASENAAESDTIDVLTRAVANLDVDHRIAVILRYRYDLSIAEIALRTGQPEGTIKSRLHYALRELRAAYDAGARVGGGAS